MTQTTKRLRIIVYGNALAAAAVAAWFFLAPMVILAGVLGDPGLRGREVPGSAFRWHRSLSERFEPWARSRVASGRAAQLNTYDISGTEWPVYSAVLSNLSDAPFIGESALLFSLTRRPLVDGPEIPGDLPRVVYPAFGFYAAGALALLGTAAARARRQEKDLAQKQFPSSGLQLGIWSLLTGAGALALVMSWDLAGALLLLPAQFLPRSGGANPQSP